MSKKYSAPYIIVKEIVPVHVIASSSTTSLGVDNNAQNNLSGDAKQGDNFLEWLDTSDGVY